MNTRVIDEEIRLIPNFQNDAVSLPWYQDLDVCKQVDQRNEPYDLELLHNMYEYLSSHGECYYVEYQGILVGDVSLRDDGEVAIVICKEYQNRHIGRRCISEMVKLAAEKGMAAITANIYSFVELPCPAVLILGDGDRVGKVAAYNRRWAEKTKYPLHIVAGAAHNSNEDRPEEVNRIIGEFLMTIH